MLLLATALTIVSVFGASAAPAQSPATAPAAATLPTTPCSGGTTKTCELWATTGTLTLPGPVSVPIWGYGTASGAATLPGPALIVNQGDTVNVILHNDLPAAAGNSSLAFPGQGLAPDRTGIPNAPPTKTYTFVAGNPGTYLYQAGLTANGQVQVAMGLFGALVVQSSAAGTAYGTSASAFVDQSLLVLSEIDPALNNSADPTAYNMSGYAPRYWLINGKAYPQTDPIDSAAGNTVLLRYINAGLLNHSMGLLGMHQTVLASDAQPLTHSYHVIAETIPAGTTLDTVATVPGSAPAGAKFAVYNAGGHLDNNGVRVSTAATAQIAFGGMLTFLTVAGAPSCSPDSQGPLTSGVSAAPNPTNGAAAVLLSASISDVASCNSSIDAAEYFIDSLNSAPIPMSGTFGSPTTSVNATISVAALSALASGNHTLYVHGHDATGNWGTVSSVVLNLDKAGPATSNISIAPNPTNGTADVNIQATGSDAATGGANVDQAEYNIDGGGAQPMTLNQAPAPTVGLQATIAAATIAGLTEDAHTINIRSHDDRGNWGAFASVSLNVDKTGPATSGVSVTPNPNNGTLSYDINKFAVKVSATATDPIAGGVQSNIKALESFIDCAPPAAGCVNGTGTVFFANDVQFNSPSEPAYTEIPLSAIQALTTGAHTIYVHAQDAAGNWGPAATTTLIIDRTPPTISSITALSANPTNAASVQFQVSFSEDVTGLTSGNFTLMRTGGLTGGSVTSISGGGAAWTVTVSTGSGSGTLGLNLTSAAGITDLAGNALSTAGIPFTGQIYTIDKTPPTFSSITLAPGSFIVGSTSTVNLTGNGASDGAGGTGVVGGEYWLCPSACTNPAPGGGTAFSGLTASIPVGALLPGHQYTVRTRIRDAAGNWSTGGTGIRSATLTVTTANNILTDGFESGNFSAWSSTSTGNTTRLNVTAAAALFGASGMQAQGNNTNYVQNNFTPVAGNYDARFYFRPNGNTSSGKDIFAAATSSGFGTTVFRVRYRLNGGTPQVQIQVGTSNTNTTWTNINGGTANNVIEVVWQAVGSGGPSPGSLQLIVNGAVAQTLTTTSTNSVAAVRLGSITSTGNATSMFFDAFASKRSASPLIGS
jgi:hypothetical protein